mmetsp:Transcript_17891/g.36133  ORF Transcript_17891/g.36133 Transcript_17891/m.36133 type:complete len:209 (+) Transcript_17891:215-841(+)
MIFFTFPISPKKSLRLPSVTFLVNWLTKIVRWSLVKSSISRCLLSSSRSTSGDFSRGSLLERTSLLALLPRSRLLLTGLLSLLLSRLRLLPRSGLLRRYLSGVLLLSRLLLSELRSRRFLSGLLSRRFLSELLSLSLRLPRSELRSRLLRSTLLRSGRRSSFSSLPWSALTSFSRLLAAAAFASISSTAAASMFGIVFESQRVVIKYK